jgi:hypothetical protein
VEGLGCSDHGGTALPPVVTGRRCSHFSTSRFTTREVEDLAVRRRYYQLFSSCTGV